MKDANLDADVGAIGRKHWPDTGSDKQSDTEALILAAAEREFVEKGFDAARTTSIAEKAGVTHAMLHYYFRTKEKLFRRIIDQKMGDICNTVMVAIDDDTRPIADAVRTGVENHFDFLSRNPELPFFIISELRRNPELLKSMLGTMRDRPVAMIQRMQHCIDAASERGECLRVDAFQLMMDIMSLNLITFINPVMVDALFEGNFINREAYLASRREEIVQTILKRIRP